MTAPLLTLVMPVYNVAAYLPACLDSLSAQTLVPDEIIVIDDGSTDECPQILADYARRMTNLCVVRQENGGLSAARNTGLARARGKWLAFVDSDDFVAPDMYERLVSMAETNNLDMALCNASYHFEGREPDRPIFPDAAATEVITGSEWLRRRLAENRLPHMVWMHLYRREFIERHAFSFVPGLIHEDVIWTTRALLAAQRLKFDPAQSYHYRIRIRRPTGAALLQRLEQIVDSSIYNAYELAKIAAAEADSDTARLVRWQLVDGALSIFHKIGKMPEASQRKMLRQRLGKMGFYRFLFSNAVGFRQHRRVLSSYLRGMLKA